MEASINPKELVSLDTTLSTLMLPYLKAFKASAQGYPSKLESEENWRAVLDEIVWALDAKASGEYWAWNKNQMANFERHQKGMELLGKHFSDLWI